MCRAVVCRTCGKMGWAGCGRHVEAVLRDYPPAARCPGHESDGGGSFFARFLKR